jgi:echinoderm microtubule-associated protein-like 6
VQDFFDLHQDDIVALAIHPNRNIVATGQMAAQGKAKMVDVFVWDVSSQQVLAQLTGFHRRAVNCLQFSPSGGKLLTIGQDD